MTRRMAKGSPLSRCDPPDDVAFHIRGGGTALGMKCALFADATQRPVDAGNPRHLRPCDRRLQSRRPPQVGGVAHPAMYHFAADDAAPRRQIRGQTGGKPETDESFAAFGDRAPELVLELI